MKEGFKSIDEILKEVAEDEGMTFEEVKDLWDHQKNYIKKQMDTEGVYAIFLPYIGTLSLNVKQFSKELTNKTRDTYRNFINKVAKLKDHEKYTKFDNAHKKVTGVNRLARYIVNNYQTGIEISKKLLAHNKCWNIITKYSNKGYEKRETPIKRYD